MLKIILKEKIIKLKVVLHKWLRANEKKAPIKLIKVLIKVRNLIMRSR